MPQLTSVMEDALSIGRFPVKPGDLHLTQLFYTRKNTKHTCKHTNAHKKHTNTYIHTVNQYIVHTCTVHAQMEILTTSALGVGTPVGYRKHS